MLENQVHPSISFLTTKLTPVPPRPDVILRTRLYEKLSTGLAYPLTLILAPAGFGKTTLVSGWRQAQAQPIAWISLDEGDNDPDRFWAYFTAALQKTYPSIHNTISISYPYPQLSSQTISTASEANLASLINFLAATPDEMVIILDDFHVISTKVIQDRIAFLIEHGPSNLHLILISRIDPNLPMARLRARRQVFEIRASDLRFTSSEAANFLKQIMGQALKPADVETLERRTEGWIAGLQLAALSIRERQDMQSVYVEINGDDRYIQDYLVDEVFQHEPAEVQQFMLQTSILERLSAPLCDALTGRTDSQAILERMERTNLFIVPLDTSRHWYRYHQLLADMLRSRLTRQTPELVKGYHLKAAEWYRASQELTPAVAHYLAAQDMNSVLTLIENRAKSMLLDNDMGTLMAWFKDLPDAFIRGRPELSVLYAWTLIYTSRFGDIEDYLVAAEAGLSQSDPSINPRSPVELDALFGQIDALRGTVAMNFGDTERGLELSRRAMVRLPDSEAIWRGLLGLNLGDAYARMRKVDEAWQAFDEGIRASRLSGNQMTLLVSYGSQANMLFELGQLQEAEKVYRQALAVSSDRPNRDAKVYPTMGKIHAYYAQLLYEWNRLEEAGEQARLGIERCTQWGHLEHMIDSYLQAVAVYRARGAYADAITTLDQAEGIVRNTMELFNQSHPTDRNPIIERSFERLKLARARLSWRMGDAQPLASWIADNGLTPESEPRELVVTLLYVHWLIYKNQADRALIWLNRSLQLSDKSPWTRIKIIGYLNYAQTYDALGDQAQAWYHLGKALELGEPQGYIRTFIDEGEPVKKMVERYEPGKGDDLYPVSQQYLNQLLANFPVVDLSGETVRGTEIKLRNEQDIQEPLSQQEVRILRLVAAGRSNQEIAGALVISTNTVKTHLKRIYAKLVVSSRVEAVEQGHRLKLI